jgi:PAS domain S-box-containing protein
MSGPEEAALPDHEEALAAMARMAADSQQAAALLEAIASAVFAPRDRDLRHLTWPDGQGDQLASNDTVSAEERLAAAEKRFRTLVEQIPAVTFMAVLGEGKNEIYVSPHVEQLLGYSQQEWLENPFLWYWRLHPDDRELWNQEFARGCRTGGPFQAECRFLARDESVKWVHGEARIVKDDLGRPLFLQGVAFDITESKRAQEVLLNEAVARAKVEEELELARRVQTSILPRDPRVDGLEIAAIMIPASEVGGDYYDVLPARDGAWLAIGDVAGHGLNAGLMMLMLQSATASLAAARPTASPREVVSLLNDLLVENVRRRLGRDEHATFTLLRYWRDGRVVYAGAHEDLLLYRRATGQVEAIRTPGVWIGARRGMGDVLVDSTLQLEDGDVILLYTDGVTEGRDRQGEMFDLPRLVTALAEVASRPVEEIRDALVARVRDWTAVQDDDITMVVLRYRAG